MRRFIRISFLVLALGVGLFGYTQVMARVASGTPPPIAAEHEQAHEVLVIKSTRELHLLRNGATFRRYAVSLGGSPTGHKSHEGDERTPEGTYTIDWRNENSVAHLSLHISYPNTEDTAAAVAQGDDPGGNIMIHGLPNGWGFLGRLHLSWDWTNGCIAVTNTEMREIWSMVPNGTPITIVDTI
ncbi:L,D-transpeptidase family protein [Octadecabacter ascidiaceicola]|uniref:L,D-transpeptidase catalytic domain n=1 Tax=Octadecabacter ascidiaceicola TaxID=1655543 RepID=A0A238K9P5_9RHOB|nr:L,D-transpeptidase family protein [Octadecabacter ascidiaceicola]SMX39197.1 L,D-transpeptidase catalytic domain [Octadecabacter ascidiaceicola]